MVRAYGGLRFDPAAAAAPEWRPFGTFYFFIPLLEFRECANGALLACTVLWDEAGGDLSFDAALGRTLAALNEARPDITAPPPRFHGAVRATEHWPDELTWHLAVRKTLEALDVVEGGPPGEAAAAAADVLAKVWLWDPAAIDHMPLTKVVMARKSELVLDHPADPLELLQGLQEKDPSAYQFALQLESGDAFVGCTPERLFVRRGLEAASEAVAATRARDVVVGQDFAAGLELMASVKDHNEFEIVRESVLRRMKLVCADVVVEVDKRLLKQARVQHLYSRLNARLDQEIAEARTLAFPLPLLNRHSWRPEQLAFSKYDLLSILHPTPAVCGHPQGPAKAIIAANETFDRGFYAGPIGYFCGAGAEFAVGIRSALVPTGATTEDHAATSSAKQGPKLVLGQPISSPLGVQDEAASNRQKHRIMLYSGVGVVRGTSAADEWQELNLKISQFQAVLAGSGRLDQAPNINALWAKLIVEESCRLGSTYFCIAPGSRSSPLALAADAHPRARCVVCLDERSLAFHALGYGRGARVPAVVITSSGTAVSNLLPAVVEASQDCVPLLLLTADRPPELHDVGANQSIDQLIDSPAGKQIKHFGDYVRHFISLPAPSGTMPARMVLTAVDSAIFRASAAPAGPVHINCSFREPLAPVEEAWSTGCLAGLAAWEQQKSPFTTYVGPEDAAAWQMPKERRQMGALQAIVALLGGAKRALVVVGGLASPAEAWAAARLAGRLRLPVVADVLSGLRLQEGKEGLVPELADIQLQLVQHLDHVLLSTAARERLAPDVVLQIGARLTSKRVMALLESATTEAHILVEEHPFRSDPSHSVTHRTQMSIAAFAASVVPAPNEVTISSSQKEYTELLLYLSEAAGRQIRLWLGEQPVLTEPYVAAMIAATLPTGDALFLGNSMAIRDADMYALDPSWSEGAFVGHSGSAEVSQVGASAGEPWQEQVGPLKPWVAANRGASGIDGVLSTASGYAAGCCRPVTLLVGDVSFLHDSNGLLLLVGQPPVTVVVVNNGGGGIFSLLPVADTVPAASFSTLFSTPHGVNIEALCRAHRLSHTRVATTDELRQALHQARQRRAHGVIEVDSSIAKNVDNHRSLQASCCSMVDRALRVIDALPKSPFSLASAAARTIAKVDFFHYSLPLKKRLTTAVTGNGQREGFLLRLRLSGGTEGFGEVHFANTCSPRLVAPLQGLHREEMADCEQQLLLIGRQLEGLRIPPSVLLLDGSLKHWLATETKLKGPENLISENDMTFLLKVDDLYPSVRCGLEMAVLTTLAGLHGRRLSSLLMGEQGGQSRGGEGEALEDGVRVCALVSSEGTPAEVAAEAAALVRRGFCTLKLKVARRASPLEDAAVVAAVREAVDPQVALRADANRKWTLAQAWEFARALPPSCTLQYIEEPVWHVFHVPDFWDVAGIPVALDESVDEGLFGPALGVLRGVTALVIKPGRVGGFEQAAMLARQAVSRGVTPVISSAFESSLGLSAYAELARCVDGWRSEASADSRGGLVLWDEAGKSALAGQSTSRQLGLEVPPSRRQVPQLGPAVAHGLGTSDWLASDIVASQHFTMMEHRATVRTAGAVDDGRAVWQSPLRDGVYMSGQSLAGQLRESQLEANTVHRCSIQDTESVEHITVGDECVSFEVLELTSVCESMQGGDCGPSSANGCRALPTVVFLHGFLGSANDWRPVMELLVASHRCLAVGLPGHHRQSQHDGIDGLCQNVPSWGVTMEALAALLTRFSGSAGCYLVGYSMGARMALHLALKANHCIMRVFGQLFIVESSPLTFTVRAAAIVSGSPGLREAGARATRARRDAALAEELVACGLEHFVHRWYRQPLWRSLAALPNFEKLKEERIRGGNPEALAGALVAYGVGTQESLWDELPLCRVPLLLVVGAADNKYHTIAKAMRETWRAAALSTAEAEATERTTERAAQRSEQLPEEVEYELTDAGFDAFYEREMQRLALEDTLRQQAPPPSRSADSRHQLEADAEEPPAAHSRDDERVAVLAVTGAGHAVHIEQPVELASAFCSFFTQHHQDAPKA
eukprot:SM000345S12838  [mRNA]  locus=s345:73550:85963:+ [translate_table: standard]